MVLGHEFPSGSHILASLGFLQECWFDGSLRFANGDNSLLYSIEIVPPILSQETQPHVQD